MGSRQLATATASAFLVPARTLASWGPIAGPWMAVSHYRQSTQHTQSAHSLLQAKALASSAISPYPNPVQAHIHPKSINCTPNHNTPLAQRLLKPCISYQNLRPGAPAGISKPSPWSTAAAAFSISSTTRMAGTVRDTISLTPAEQQLFSLLLAAAQHAGSNTMLRCAGGWVRDKLLGKESADIDIALDNMLGKDFAELVNQFLQSQGKETRTAAVIQANPDQSKHLETARMKVNNIWIDLVNLRSETYAQDSRIPQMQFGSAEQDALRRDFTINSMFYNINKGCVEDLTGRGLQDLRDGVIRTPLPPQETFLDDPLRVLRAVRFGTRFGFELDTAILEAAASEPVRSALSQKVSKERVGTELEGMFNGQSPVAAVQLLQQLSLFPIVFALHSATAHLVGDSYGEPCLACMSAADKLCKSKGMQLDAEERRMLLLAALLLPLRLCLAPVGPKGKTAPVAVYVVRESLKWRAKDADITVQLHELAPTLLDVYCQLTAAGGYSQGSSVPDSVKVSLGNVIRKLKQHWKLGALLAPILATRSGQPLGVDAAAAGDGAGRGSASPLPEISADQEEQRCQEVCSTLLAAVDAFGLQDCWQWKPLMDGKQIMALLGVKGAELGKATVAVMDWQLAHPQGSLEDCQAYVQQWWNGVSK